MQLHLARIIYSLPVGWEAMAEIIDAHHHLWRYSPRDYGWITPDMEVLQRNFLAADLESEMRTAGVEGSIVVQARQSMKETQWLLDLADRSSSILGVVGWVPLTASNLPAVLKKLEGSRKLKGVRHVIQDEPNDDFILQEDFNEGITALQSTDLVYDILIHERHLPQTIAFVKRHPSQIFVLDHIAKPRIRDGVMEPWKENLKRLAEYENIFCKLSGMVTEADWATWTLDGLRPYLDAVLDAFGAERLMVGSDWPVCILASTYKQWWSALHEWCSGMSQLQAEEILGGTARRVYKLGPV
jgi:L-fuconolactonase